MESWIGSWFETVDIVNNTSWTMAWGMDQHGLSHSSRNGSGHKSNKVQNMGRITGQFMVGLWVGSSSIHGSGHGLAHGLRFGSTHGSIHGVLGAGQVNVWRMGRVNVIVIN